MIKIPLQLQREEFRFVKLLKRNKTPFEANWTQKNYKYDDKGLIEWIDQENNYGIIGGFGNLIIIDFDNEDIQNKFSNLLPKTFTVMTGSGKLHKYFICDNPKSLKILDGKKNTLIDIQGEGKQAVAPFSTHPNGNLYVVIDDCPIAKLNFKQIQFLFADYLKEKDQYQFEHQTDIVIQQIKKKISLINLMSDYGYDTTKNPTMCKLGHDSNAGKCFSWNDNKGLWYCFHCDRGGDIISFIMQHDNCDFKNAKQKLMGLSGIKDNLHQAVNVFKIDYIQFAEEFWELQPFFYDKARNWWLWDFVDCYWKIIDKTELFKRIYESSKDEHVEILKSETKSQITTAFEIVGRGHIPKDVFKTWIQFKDKVYDLKTGNIFNSTPEYFNTNPIPFEVGLTQETPVIDKIFTEWVGEQKEILYEILAYCILQDYPIHRIFCLVGSGNNGKSCFLKLLKTFIGNSNCISTELDMLLERFGSAGLFKHLVCIMGETNFNQLSKTSLLKRLCGGDLIDFEFKGKDRFSGENYAKLLIATNTLPTTTDRTDGFYRRWLIVLFPNKFNEKMDIIATIPEKEYKNLALKCLYTLKKIIEGREFTNEGTVEQRKEKFEMFSNPLRQFIKERYETDINAEIPVFEFCDAFMAYLSERGYRKLSKIEIGQQMNIEGFESKQIQKKMGGEWKNWRYYIGLKPVTSITDITHVPIHILSRKKLIQSGVISAISVIDFDEKAVIWQQCAYPNGDKVCGDTPCNEFEGAYYCKKHFEKVQVGEDTTWEENLSQKQKE